MDISPIVGAYVGKASISAITKKFVIPLAMTAIVHERGTIKYVSYSWQNDPSASNSTVQDNLDAIERHLGAHSMGKLMDVEGLPHLFHIACRASMMVTTHLRNRTRQSTQQPPHSRMVRQKDEVGAFSESLAGTQITSEELLACSKKLPDIYHDNLSVGELYALIRGHLFECNLVDYPNELPYLNNGLGYPEPTENVFENVDAFEGLFQLLYRYVTLSWKQERNGYIAIMKAMHKKQPYRDIDLRILSKYLCIDLQK